MIGWYVHHHGRGHATRARCVLPHLPGVVVLTGLDGDWDVPVLRLPPDSESGCPAPTPRGRLHHAPLRVPSVAERTAALTGWMRDGRPDAVVVDVSVEVTLLARLSGAPPIVVRMAGDRRDHAHLTGFDAAVSLLAPFPEELEDPTTPAWVRDRTAYVGGFSRYDDRELTREAAREHTGMRRGAEVLVLPSTGGEGFAPGDVRAAAAASPDWGWTVLGDVHVPDPPPNLRLPGWIDDVFPFLVAADVVVASGGDNAVMEVAAARRPLICIPDQRPFHEQEHRGAALADAGLALVRPSWPEPERWCRLLEAAAGLPTDGWTGVVDGGGAQRAAEHIASIAAS